MAGTLAAPAVDVISESFAFGPGVPGRMKAKAGDFFQCGPVQSGTGEAWASQKMNFHKDSAKFVEGGGLQLVAGEKKENFTLFTVIDPAKLGGGKKTLTAAVDFLPGTLWGKNVQGAGITGLWVGLHNGDRQGLMASMKDFPIVAARVAFEDDNKKARLLMYVFEEGNLRTVHGEPFSVDARGEHRLTLRISPKGPRAECEFMELSSGNCSMLDTKLAAMPVSVDTLQVDLTSMRPLPSEMPPVIRKVTLKSE